MSCLNKNIPAFAQMADDFGEVRTSFLLDSYFPNKIPTYEEFISDKDIKRALGIVPMSKTIDEIGVSFSKKHISDQQVRNLKRAVDKKNNFNIINNIKNTYILFNLRQIGESRNDSFSWGLMKNDRLPNIDAKIERAQNKFVDAKQNQTPIAKLEEIKANKDNQLDLFGLSEYRINEYKKQCK